MPTIIPTPNVFSIVKFFDPGTKTHKFEYYSCQEFYTDIVDMGGTHSFACLWPMNFVVEPILESWEVGQIFGGN